MAHTLSDSKKRKWDTKDEETFDAETFDAETFDAKAFDAKAFDAAEMFDTAGEEMIRTQEILHFLQPDEMDAQPPPPVLKRPPKVPRMPAGFGKFLLNSPQTQSVSRAPHVYVSRALSQRIQIQKLDGQQLQQQQLDGQQLDEQQLDGQQLDEQQLDGQQLDEQQQQEYTPPAFFTQNSDLVELVLGPEVSCEDPGSLAEVCELSTVQEVYCVPIAGPWSTSSWSELEGVVSSWSELEAWWSELEAWWSELEGV
jgi:hypothetical protein